MADKKTKIVATLGLASEDKETIRKMIEGGMNVARLNFSHGDYEWHAKVINTVRELSREKNTPIGIIADLQGPRIRTAVDKELEIKKGDRILVSDILRKKEDGQKIIFLDYPGIIEDIEEGNDILIEDGMIRLKVLKKEKEFLETEVIAGGIVKNHKGVNIPDAKLHFGAMTDKDEKDLEFALEHKVDFIALSFVSNGEEIKNIRGKMQMTLGSGRVPQIISKIERKEAIKNIDEIIKASDAVMVARGDLGIEMNESKVVIYQKEIIAKCLKAAKPVIVATQMLNSMIENPIPTRAEVSDVSNAVIDHADAVMLSGESASGKYPVEAVRTMAEIIRNTEDSPFDDVNAGFLDDDLFTDYASVINSAHELAKSSNAKAIVMFSDSGFTARIMSHHRPGQEMLVAANNLETYNQLSIVWGAEAYLFNNGEERENFINLVIEKAKTEGKLKSGDKVVVILGKMRGVRDITLVGIKEV